MKPVHTTPHSGVERAKRSVVLGTAGHIDHGKTALVFALTGTETDRLPEEKSRGITIDLGFAHLPLRDANDEMVDLSLIDVPGHHAFVRNMLAGAGGIDCVMLVIAADEGVKAQTQEHLAICGLLGISDGVIALTKKDAVSSERLAQAREEVDRFVRHTFLEKAPIVDVSAFTREGIPELKAELARLVSRIPPRAAERIVRLPLDRAFSMRGFGTVVTGTLQSGTIVQEDALELQPEGRVVRVRGIQVHNEACTAVRAPTRVALNLAGIEVSDVGRGDVVVPPRTLLPVSTVDVEISALPGVAPLRHRSRVRVHAFASDVLATVLLYEGNSLGSGESGLARLRLAKPIVFIPGDRFVIRQLSPAMTMGGGRVLDAHPVPRLRKSVASQWLGQVRSATIGEQMQLRVGRRSVGGIAEGALSAETGLTAVAIREFLKPLLPSSRIVRSEDGKHLIADEALRTAAQVLMTEIGRTRAGSLSRAELRSRAKLTEPVFELALRMLRNQGQIFAEHDLIAIPDRLVGCGDERIATVKRIYAAAGLSSPLVSDVSRELDIPLRQLQPMLTSLIRAKVLVRMGSDNLLIDAGAINKLIEELRHHRGETFDVARFKSFTGLTRKHAIPLLEYLDGARVTRNDNATRIVL